MFRTLLTSSRFAPLFWTQFLSALSDSFVKNALVVLILYEIGSTEGATLVTLAGAVLIAPFFILSGVGGQLADRFDKAAMAERIKRAEIPVAVVAAAGFAIGSITMLFVALALYGAFAALFGPIKYGILPVHLAESELPAGNALVEGATFTAILAGTIAGTLAAGNDGSAWLIAVSVVGLSVLCWLAATRIPPTGEAAPELVIDRNPWTSTTALLTDLRSDPRIWTGALIQAWFWLVGAIALSLLPTLVKELIGGTEGVIAACLLVFTVGIAWGSLLAARASKTRPN
ncbi:MAG: MFS transporter, partial [Hyphomicrobiaceae bacterium]|nr:MFS transporter [Hyphomicrobiaceae bacterium]